MKKFSALLILVITTISCVELQTKHSSRPTIKSKSSIVNPEKFKRKKWICMDKNLKQVFAVDAYNVSPFRNGLAAVRSYPSGYVDTKGNFTPVKARVLMDFHGPATWVSLRNADRYSLINRRGKVISKRTYSKVDNFKEGVNITAVYNNNKQFGFVNIKGKLVIPFGKYIKKSSFSDGMLAVQSRNGKWGAINSDGVETVPCTFDFVASFSEGLCRARKGKYRGYIDKKGKTVIPFKYLNGSSSFMNGYVRVQIKKGVTYRGGGQYLLNKKGEVVYKTKKGYINKVEINGLINVNTRSGVYGWTNFKDQWVIKPVYFTPSSFQRGGYEFPYSTGRHLKYKMKVCLFDTKGNIVIPPQYKSIYTGSGRTNGYLILEDLSGRNLYYTLDFQPINIPGITLKWLTGHIDSPYLVYRNPERLFGYISKKGKLLQKAKYIKAQRPSEGYSWAQERK